MQKSVTNGSIFKKRKILSVRLAAPVIEENNYLKIKVDSSIPSRNRSVLDIKEENYEELNISDELFAEQNADIAELDNHK